MAKSLQDPSLPPLAVTMGDASGVGPELILAGWRELGEDFPFFCVGDIDHLRLLAGPNHRLRRMTSPDDFERNAQNVLHVGLREPAVFGTAQPINARSTLEMIETAVRAAQSKAACGAVTAPINKKVLVDGAGFSHPGHTEFLAALDGRARSVMMLASPELRVVPVTIHIALRDVPDALTPALLKETIEITAQSLERDFGVADPRISVAGLNPHAGEQGLMGSEEIQFISKCLDELRDDGLNVSGPLSADTMFHKAARASYDAAVCMYHDQALIPIKTIDFDRGVNITLGLSFIRTSPDHGTAYDIAGTFSANPSSMIEAIRTAQNMANHRAQYE